MLADLIKTHAAALAAWVNSQVPGKDLVADGDLYEAFCDAEYALVAFQCSSGDEVQQKLAYAAECPTLADAITIDLNREFMASILLPGNRRDVSPAVSAAIQKWQEADEAFRTFCNASTDLKKDEAKADELYDVQTAAEDHLIAEPCTTLADVRAKAAIVMGHEGIFESVTNGTIDGEHVMQIFLRSIVGEGGR
jgi:hypothetical protein